MSSSIYLFALVASTLMFTYAMGCYTGYKCRRADSWSQYNNEVYCCANGEGPSVFMMNGVMVCSCYGSGNVVFRNGRQLSEREARPYLQQVELAQGNMQAMMGQVNKGLNNIGRFLNNMFGGF